MCRYWHVLGRVFTAPPAQKPQKCAMPARKPPPDTAFAAMLKTVRGHTKQVVVARMAGCSTSNIGEVEAARQHPSVEIISAYLQITERRNDMERRNMLLATAAGLGLIAIPEQALAEAWENAPAADAWEAITLQRGTEMFTLPRPILQEQIGSDLFALARAGRGGHLSRAAAHLSFFYARTFGSNEGAAQWHTRAVTRARESQDPDTVAWVQACIALAYCYERDKDTDTLARVNEALTVGSGRGQIGAVAATKANLAGMHVQVARGDLVSAAEYRDAALRAAEGVESVSQANSLFFNEECWLSSLAYASAKTGDVTTADDWAAQARRAGEGGHINEHLGLYAAIGAHHQGDPDAPDAARTVMEGLGEKHHSISLKTLAVEAGAAEYSTT